MTRRFWTEVELQLLRWGFADSNTADLATVLDRPYSAVAQKATILGLRKSAEFLASLNSGRMQRGKQHPSMIASQFKPGLVPWNKGTNYVAGGRSAETRFVAGNKPHTWVPVGTYRVNSDGYLDQKMTDDSRGPRDWVSVHRLVWMAANGAVPDGHVVVFKSGRRTTELSRITLDAVELVTRAELMARNSVHRYPKEIARLVQLRGAVNRQINRRTNEQDDQRPA